MARVSLSPPRPLSMLSRLRRARKNMCITVTAKRSVKESGFDFILFRPGNKRASSLRRWGFFVGEVYLLVKNLEADKRKAHSVTSR